MYISTKTYGHDIGLSCAFRQWRAQSHCQFIHGYALKVRIEFEAATLDDRNWVIDFGSLKSLKEQIVMTFDHKLVVAKDDPDLGQFQLLHDRGLAQVVYLDAVGCEAFARSVYGMAVLWLHANNQYPRVRVRSVEVSEHGANSAIYEGDK